VLKGKAHSGEGSLLSIVEENEERVSRYSPLMNAIPKLRVAFVNTHPIQYFVPLYSYLNRTGMFAVTGSISVRLLSSRFPRPCIWAGGEVAYRPSFRIHASNKVVDLDWREVLAAPRMARVSDPTDQFWAARNVLRCFNIDVVKLDLDGAEFGALPGLARHLKARNAGHTPGEEQGFLLSRGYYLFHLGREAAHGVIVSRSFQAAHDLGFACGSEMRAQKN
jgi:hypothetical protein